MSGALVVLDLQLAQQHLVRRENLTNVTKNALCFCKGNNLSVFVLRQLQKRHSIAAVQRVEPRHIVALRRDELSKSILQGTRHTHLSIRVHACCIA